MLAGIEFGLLHLFPHRVNAFKNMVYFSNGETLLGSCQLPWLSFLRKLVCMWGQREERCGGPPLSGKFWNQMLLVFPREGKVSGSHFLLYILLPSVRRATSTGNNSTVLISHCILGAPLFRRPLSCNTVDAFDVVWGLTNTFINNPWTGQRKNLKRKF